MNGSIPVLKNTSYKSPVKVMFIVAYDIDRVILHHAVSPREIVNAAYYCKFLLEHLRPAIRRIDDISWY